MTAPAAAPPVTRADLVARAQRRALRELTVNRGGAGIANAMASLGQDLAENAATATSPAVVLAEAYVMAGGPTCVADALDVIEEVQ